MSIISDMSNSVPYSKDEMSIDDSKASRLSMHLLIVKYNDGFITADQRAQLLELGVERETLQSVEDGRIGLLGGGKIPVFDEIGRSFSSLGDVITGNPDKAASRWSDWEDTSFIGSSGKTVGNHISASLRTDPAAKARDLARAEKAAKGLARATGTILTGGGLLRNAPVFEELARAGDSLGDVFAGESHLADDKWQSWEDTSLFGTAGKTSGNLVSALFRTGEGRERDLARAAAAAQGFGKAAATSAITGAAIGATIITGGAAAPLGTAFAVGASAAVGAAFGAGGNAAVAGIHGKKVDVGALVGSGILGGITGGIGGLGAKPNVHVPRHPSLTSSSSSVLSESSKFISKGDLLDGLEAPDHDYDE